MEKKNLYIYKLDKQGNKVKFPNADMPARLGEYTYSAQRMAGTPTLTATLNYPSCLDDLWTGEEFVEFRGEKYYVDQIPTSSKDNKSIMYKHELQFVSERIVLENVYLMDVVTAGADTYHSNSTSVKFMGDIHEFVGRVNASMTKSGIGYSVVIDDDITSDSKLVSLDNVYLADALQSIYTIYDLPYYFVGKICHIGYTEHVVSTPFEYRKGLVSIKRTNANYKIVNRVTGVGSSDNIPFYYPNDDETGTIERSQNLMPSIYRQTGGAERFYNALNNTYKIPGTNDYYSFKNTYSAKKVKEIKVDFSDIKPTIEGVTNASGQLLGEIADIAFDENDSDELGTGEGNNVFNGTDEYVHSYFYIKLHIYNGDYGFNLFEQGLEGGTAVINMTTGNCAACEFEIGVTYKDGDKRAYNPVLLGPTGNLIPGDFEQKVTSNTSQYVSSQQDTSKNEVWIAVKKDNTSFGVVMPNATNNYRPSVGDKFVITGIKMPKSLVLAAEKRLEEELIKYMSENNDEKFTFSVNFSRVFLADNSHLWDILNENARIYIKYNNREYLMYVNSYTCKADKNCLYDISVELVDKLSANVSALRSTITEIAGDIIGEKIGSGGNVSTSDILSKVSRHFISKRHDDRTPYKVSSDTAFEIGEFVSGASGAIVYKDKETGQTVGELDKLYVRMKAYFETLEIIHANSVGGKMIITPGGSIKVNRVEETKTSYRCYFLADQDGEKIENRFVVGDQGYCQVFNAKVGVSNNISNHYYWRLVTAVGNDYIELSKPDCDTGSGVPVVGDVINQRGNRNNIDRQNVLEFSSVDSFSPSIMLYQGINSYSLVGKDVVSYGVDKTSGKAFMNVYGEMYVGDREENTFIKYTQDKGVEIKGTLSVGTKLGDGKTIEQALEDATQSAIGTANENISNFMDAVTKDIEDLQNQIDGAIETWFNDPAPTLTNYPANEWTTDEEKNIHLGDLYYSSEGKAYRFQMDGNNYVWKMITDSDITKALADAKKAQDIADGKRTVFVKQPTDADSYQVGDLWVNATYGTTYSNDVLRAVSAKTAGSPFSINHWTKASKYTDDTKAEQVQQNVNNLSTTVNTLSGTVLGMKDFTDTAFADGIVDRSEASAIDKYLNNINTTKADVQNAYSKVYENALLDGKAKTNLADAYKSFSTSATELVTSITNAIADGITTSKERADVDAKYTNFNAKYGDFIAYLNEANRYIQDKINATANDALTQIGGLAYLKKALREDTTIEGGLIQSSVLALGYTNESNVYKVMSGTNGIYDKTALGGGIASWWGGAMKDRDTFTAEEMPTDVAKALIRMDGSGYLADHGIWWGTDGKIHADPQSFIINENQLGDYLELFQIIYKGSTKDIDYIIPQYVMQKVEVATSVKIGNAYLKYDSDSNSIYVEGEGGEAAGFWAKGFISSKGLNPGTGDGSGGDGSATALYQLNDVAKNESGTNVLGAAPGKVLTYGEDGKWYAADAVGLDETALAAYLTSNNYAKKSDIPSLSGYATENWVNAQLNNKVDNVVGMGLSHNDFTDALLAKLNGIAEGANNYILPVAKAAVLGGVMIGSTLTASATGVLNLPEVMTAGTYAKVTTDAYGRVTGGFSLSASDIPTLSVSKIAGLQDALDKKIDKSDFATEFDKAMQRWFVRDTANKGLHPADYDSEAVGLYSDSYISSKGVNPGTGGGTEGASSLGELNNVGSWADTIPTADRIMVQRKGATHWESLNLSDIGLNETQLGDYLTTNNYAKKSDIPSLSGYATEKWVLDKGYITSAALTGYATQSWVNTQLRGYATSSALKAVSDKLDDFLTGTDTDNVINKWKELEAFLAGFQETDTLAGALTLKADKAIAISAGTGLSGGGDLSANRTLSLNTASATALGGIKVGNRLSIDANGMLSATYTYTLPTASTTVLGGIKVGTTLNMASSGVLDIKAVGTAGTYFKVTTDAYGRVTSGSNPTTLSGFGITDGFNTVAYSGSGNAITSATFSGHTLTLVKGTTFLAKATFDDLFEKVNIGTTSAPVYAIKAKYGLYTDQFLSSKGMNTGSGGGSGSDYDRLDTWADYDASKAGWVLSAGLGNDLNTRMTSLEGGAAVTVIPSGTGSVVTGVTKSGTVITVTKGNLAFGSLTGKPTTLAGYGITDAYTKTQADGKYVLKSGSAMTGTLDWTAAAEGLYAIKLGVSHYISIDGTNSSSMLHWTGGGTVLGSPKGTTTIRSNASNLSHYYNGTEYVILDARNYNSYAPTKTGGGASGTWGISITGNAATATKLGTATVGGTSKGIYLNAGVPTAMSATVGSASLPVYMNAGTITACSTTLGVSITGTAPRLIPSELTNQDLNSYTHGSYSGRMYYAGGGNTTTNVPSGVGAYGLMIWRNASGYTGHLMSASDGNWYSRFHNNTIWSGWKRFAFTTDNVASATKLATARTINGTNFDGTANIVTSYWGTARTITIGSSAKSVNGSANVSFSRGEMKVAYGNEASYSGTPTAGGWYRIAASSTGIANNNGIFTIVAAASGYHTVATLSVSTSYGNANGTSIVQLSCSHYVSEQIRAARIVYHTAYTDKVAYLEIQMNATASTNTGVKLIGGLGWNLYESLTAGSIPSGYSSKSLTLSSDSIRATTFVGALSGNASTATKLATARTIFGKSFDGSGNVAGQALVYGTYTSTATSRYYNGGLQIRENGLVGSTQTDDAYAPAIGFHWQSKIAVSLIMSSAGNFKFLKQNFTDYANIYAGYLYSTNNGNTITIGSQNSSYAHFSSSKPFYFNTNMEINGYCLPYLNNSFTNGNANKRWSNVYSIAGNFSSYIDIGSIRISYDSANNALKVAKTDGTAAGLYAMGFLSSKGLATGTGGSGGGGSDYDRLDSWNDYTADKAGYVLSAKLGNDLNTRLTSIAANYVTTNTPQTITAQKTWTTSQRMSNTSIWRVNSATDGNATGSHWFTATDYATIQFGIGVYTYANASPRAYIGWGVNPWVTTTNLTVSSTQFTYKNNVILHAANYNDYAPTKTGTGASGTWGISISGGAAKLTTARTIWGQSFNGTANVSGALSGATTISASGLISTTAENPGFLVKSGSTNKSCVGWLSNIGAYLYSYECASYLGINPGGYPTFGGGGIDNMIPHTRKLFSKADYEYYVVLLWKTSEQTYHRLTGKVFTVISSGTTRYQAADVNLYHARWSSTGQDYSYVLNTYGQGEAWKLVTCTYGGEQYLALRHTNIQATNAFFVGTFKGASFTAVKYYTIAHGSTAAVINNSEINGSIADVTTSVMSANGTPYALTSSNVASATRLQTARTLWGQSFNGTANVSGSLSNVGSISFTGATATYSIGTASVVANTVFSRNIQSDSTLYLKSASDTSIILRVGTTEVARFLRPNGYLGLGTTAPTQRLHVSGNIRATGYFYSDAWFENTVVNKGLYNSAGDARWYWNGSGWYADKAIASASTIQGTQLKSTIATGTAPLTVASTTMVTNLNAQMVGGIGASNIPLEYDASYTPTGTAARWIRIAYFDYTSASGSYSGTFAISNNYSNNINKGLIFNVTTSHGTTAPVITQIGGDNGVFTSVRIVKDTTTTYPTAAKVYLEVYYNSTSANNVVYVSYRPENRSRNKWALYTSYTAGSIPTGYTAIATLTTTIGMATTGYLRVQQNVSISGSTNHNNRLNIDPTGKVLPYSTSTRRAGVYGVYDAAKIGHIWSMGTAYQIADDGANFGNLYGLAYKHTNNATGGTMAQGHQAVWCENGTPRVAMGTNFWVANSATVGGSLSVTGAGSVKTLTIKNTEAIGHLNFSRTSYNYITAPAGGVITFVVDGQSVGSAVAELTIQNGSLFPGTTNATSLGTSALRWSNVYTQLLNVAGAATLSSTLTVSGVLTASSTLNVSGVLNANNTTDSTSTTTGSIVCDGGVGIVKQLRVGGNTMLSGTLSVSGAVSFNTATDATSTTAAGVKVVGGLAVAKQLRVGGSLSLYKSTEAINLASGASDQKITKTVSSTFYSGVNFYGTTGSNLGHSDIQMNIYAGGSIQIHAQGGSRTIILNGTVHNNTGMYSDGYMSSKGLNDTSDMRLKNKGRDIFLSVKDIANAPAFEYTWKDGTPGAMVGSSAQYWQKVLSCSVREKKDGYLSMFYGHTAMVGLISLARHHENLEQRVARLEKEIKEKDKRILELERRVSA